MTDQPLTAAITLKRVPPAPSRVRSASASRLYFVNCWVDWLALGGLSILTVTVLVGLGETGHNAIVTPVLFPLALIVNYPHFSATLYRLYQNPDNLHEFPVTA